MKQISSRITPITKIIYVLISVGFFLGGIPWLSRREVWAAPFFWAVGFAMLAIWWFVIRRAATVFAGQDRVLVGNVEVPYERIVSLQRIEWFKDPVYRLEFLNVNGKPQRAIFIGHYRKRSEAEAFLRERMKLRY